MLEQQRLTSPKTVSACPDLPQLALPSEFAVMDSTRAVERVSELVSKIAIPTRASVGNGSDDVNESNLARPR